MISSPAFFNNYLNCLCTTICKYGENVNLTAQYLCDKSTNLFWKKCKYWTLLIHIFPIVVSSTNLCLVWQYSICNMVLKLVICIFKHVYHTSTFMIVLYVALHVTDICLGCVHIYRKCSLKRKENIYILKIKVFTVSLWKAEHTNWNYIQNKTSRSQVL